jgi:PAS domain-containing protein
LLGKTRELSAKNTKSEEFPVEISLAKWEINDETYFTAMIRDITERKKIEAQLLEKQKMLEEAQQITGLGSWEWDVK